MGPQEQSPAQAQHSCTAQHSCSSTALHCAWAARSELESNRPPQWFEPILQVFLQGGFCCAVGHVPAFQAWWRLQWAEVKSIHIAPHICRICDDAKTYSSVHLDAKRRLHGFSACSWPTLRLLWYFCTHWHDVDGSIVLCPYVISNSTIKEHCWVSNVWLLPLQLGQDHGRRS
jgi:hypothetical protein